MATEAHSISVDAGPPHTSSCDREAEVARSDSIARQSSDVIIADRQAKGRARNRECQKVCRRRKATREKEASITRQWPH